MDFSYYFLACSAHASTEASSGSPGWCSEFTSHDEMAIYVNKKSNFARVFGACTQGLSVAEVVAQTIGVNVMSNAAKARKTDPGDVVKAKLAALLRTQLCESHSNLGLYNDGIINDELLSFFELTP